jgi:curved DNA-binding protein CbpA
VSLYTDLDVDPDADPAAIAKAHRDAAKRHHPDNGGDRDQFERIQRAAVILRDPAKRARYDETGDCGDAPDNSLSALTEILTSAFDRAMQQDGWEHRDVIDQMKQLLKADMSGNAIQVREAESAKVKMGRALKKLKFKGNGRNPIGMVLEQRIGAIAAGLAQMAARTEQVKAAIASLDEYGWEFEARDPQQEAYDQMMAAMRAGPGGFGTNTTGGMWR